MGRLTQTRIARTLVVAVLAAAVYELAVALRWIHLGTEPGDGPPGEGVVVLIAIVALLGGAVWVAAASRTAAPGVHWVALPLAAVAFVVARHFTYDPYFLPMLRRMSDGGAIPASLLVVLFAGAMMSIAITIVRTRTGLTLVALVMIGCAFTSLFEGTGH